MDYHNGKRFLAAVTVMTYFQLRLTRRKDESQALLNTSTQVIRSLRRLVLENNTSQIDILFEEIVDGFYEED